MNARRMLPWAVIVSVILLMLPTALHLVAQDVVPNELELVGLIDSIDGDTVTVNGQVFDIANAELKGELTVGEMVKIHASLSDTDAWVAREVETVEDFSTDDGDSVDNADDQPEFDITGILEEVGEGYIIVSGLRIDTTGAEVESILIIGDRVKIQQELVDGNLVVREVAMDDEDNMDDSQDDMGDDHTSGKPDDWVPYIVQPGDTLDDLAAIIGTTPEALAAANGLDATQELVAGSILYGPAYHHGQDSSDDSYDDNSSHDSYDDNSSHDSYDDNSSHDSYDDDSSHDSNDDNSSHDSNDDNSSHDSNDDNSSHDSHDDKDEHD